MPGKSGPKFGQTILRDPALRKARALLILEKRITKNMSNSEIAKTLNVQPDTIAREIDWAKRQGIVANFEEQILQDLVPAALKTILELVAKDEVNPMVRADLAKSILAGTGLFRKPSDRSTYVAPPVADNGEPDTLEMYIRKTVRGGTANGSIKQLTDLGVIDADPLTPSGTLALLEGSVLADPDPSAASAPSPVGLDCDEDRTADEEQHVDVSADA